MIIFQGNRAPDNPRQSAILSFMTVGPVLSFASMDLFQMRLPLKAGSLRVASEVSQVVAQQGCELPHWQNSAVLLLVNSDAVYATFVAMPRRMDGGFKPCQRFLNVRFTSFDFNGHCVARLSAFQAGCCCK